MAQLIAPSKPLRLTRRQVAILSRIFDSIPPRLDAAIELLLRSIHEAQAVRARLSSTASVEPLVRDSNDSAQAHFTY